ncbi:MAG: SpoIIE family protein phosphatase, partial [Anaerolineae bacterium]|nr:SpoIIE family protein phosphatase [Anaerolineae bacterium]
MFSRMKIRPKIILVLTFIAVLTLGIMGYISYTIGVNTLEKEAFNKLTAVREMKASQIEAYFQLISDQIMTLSNDRMIIDAMTSFEGAHEIIASELDVSDDILTIWESNLRGYYQDEYLKRLIPNLMKDVSIDDYWPQDSVSILMQTLYISNNENETGEKENLSNPGDGSSYSSVHETYHPIIRDYLSAFGYYDIFLVDVSSGGHIVYSVFKEVDFGTSLADGPYSDTNFGRVYRTALDAEEKDFVMLVDFEPYHPSYNAPAAFIASPIFDGDEKIGVLIFQMPIDRINNIMTNNQNWKAVGLGESGETYLVGEDFLLRNQSRFLIEDNENYFQTIEDIGVSIPTIARIKNLNSTIGLQEVQTEGTMAALSGETGTAVFPDYRGVPVFSAYKPLNIQGVNWVIMSEKDEAEVFLAMQELQTNMLIGVAGLFAVIVLISLSFSRNLTRPILRLKETAAQLSGGNLDVICDIDSQDEIGELAQSFEVMRKELKRSIDDLEAINQNLEGLVAERTQELELSERKTSSIIESAGEGIIVIDQHSNIILWNQTAEKMFGYNVEEILGNPITQLIPEKYLSRHSSASKRAIEAGQLAHPGVTHEVAGLRNDGTDFPMELTLSNWSIGGETYISGILRDVTDRKRLEERIKKSEERLKFALEGSNDGLWDWNIQTEVIYFSPRWETMLGYEPGEIEPKIGSWEKMVDPEYLIPVNKLMEDHLAGKELVYEAEYPIRSKTRGWVWVLARGKVAAFDEEGKPVRFVGTHVDITERKELEAQLEKANERMSEELNFAKEIQMSLLPLIFPAFPTRSEFNIYAHLMAAREVGGDFYDFYFLDEDHLCFVIGDVSGKGAPGALLMAVSKTLIKSRAMDDSQPSSILTHVNNELSQNNDSCMFVTVFLGVLEINTGRLIYCNAGHNPPYIIHSDDTIEKMDDFHGPVIGALPNLTYKESSTTLHKNDIITLHTDGVTEAMNQEEQLYSDARYEKFIESEGLNTPQKIVDQVVRDVKIYEDGAVQADD